MSGTAAVAPGVVRRAGLDATAAMPGASPATDTEYRFDPQRTVALLADALARLHSLDPGRSAHEERGPDRLTVEAVVRRAVSDPTTATVDPAYAHMEPTRLLEVLAEGAEQLGEPEPEDLVLTHGEVGLATMWCHQGRVVGFSDWSSAAVADRHRDLARAAAVIAGALGPMLVPEFFEVYGRRPDPRRLDWWALADQLTGGAPTAVPGR